MKEHLFVLGTMDSDLNVNRLFWIRFLDFA